MFVFADSLEDGGYFDSHFGSQTLNGVQSWMREANAADLSDGRTCGFYRQRLFDGIVCVADSARTRVFDWTG